MKFTISAIISALATARKGGNKWQKAPWVNDWRQEKREADQLEAERKMYAMLSGWQAPAVDEVEDKLEALGSSELDFEENGGQGGEEPMDWK